MKTMVAAAVVSLIALTGCSATLETGYEPRKLGASSEARRGFYAQPFSPEAQQAKQYEEDYGSGGRAKPGE